VPGNDVGCSKMPLARFNFMYLLLGKPVYYTINDKVCFFK